MSKVDVLAVMDAAYAALDVVYSQDDLRKDLGEARAAIAELTEAAKAARGLLEEWEVKIDGEWGLGRDLDEIERDGDLSEELVNLRAALAKAQP